MQAKDQVRDVRQQHGWSESRAQRELVTHSRRGRSASTRATIRRLGALRAFCASATVRAAQGLAVVGGSSQSAREQHDVIELRTSQIRRGDDHQAHAAWIRHIWH
jgi:hypothetical protein